MNTQEDKKVQHSLRNSLVHTLMHTYIHWFRVYTVHTYTF